jgi:signal peptide peptidase SppA
MEITDFSKGQLWGILPDKFDVLYQKFIEMQSQELGGQGGEERPYRVTDGLAIIPVTGPLSKRATVFSFLFGGTSYAKISRDFMSAMQDSEIEGIVLDIDSPGGVVSGVEAVADLVFNSRGEKPIVAFANGMMASAAYWIGSAADAVVAQSTATVGSIGVLMIHQDISEAEKKAGVKTTYLSAGKYKAMGNMSQPLTDEAKEYFQAELDYIYSIFVDTVSRNREVEIEDVLGSMADGKVFIGQQAMDANLVDQIGGIETAVGLAGSMINENQYLSGGFDMKQETRETKIDSVEMLTAAFPDLVLKLQEQAVESSREKIKADGVAEERSRIVQLAGIQFDEQQAKNFQTIIEEGVTPAQLKAIKSLNPPAAVEEDDEDLKKDEMLKAIQEAGPENPGPDGGEGEKDYMVMVEEYQLANSCTKFDAMRAINRIHPQAREDFIRRVNA